MKKLFFSLVMIAATVALKAQTAEEIVAKHIEAIGGVDAWKKVNSMVSEGSLEVMGNKVNVVMTVLHGKGQRQDISLGGQTGFMIVGQTAGWNYMPFQGQMKPEPMTEEQVKKQQSSLDVQGVLIDYASKGHTIEDLGKDDVEGTECFKIRVNVKGEDPVTMFIDTKKYLLLKQISKINMNGQEFESATSFSNYEKLPEGILVAKSIIAQFGEITISKIVVNPPVDESIFTVK